MKPPEENVEAREAQERWADCECCVCHRLGYTGTNDFESIWVGSGMMYAHRSCHTLATIFPDMRPAISWMQEYAARYHMVPLPLAENSREYPA